MLPSTCKARRSKGKRELATAGLAVLLFAMLLAEADAYVHVPSGNPAGECPPIPDAADVALTPDEWAVVESGDILVRVVTHVDGHRVAQAVGYLDAHPLWLFDRATDSVHAPEVVDEVRDVVVLEKRPTGKLFHSTIEISFFLPRFEYTVASSYPEPPTGQCWSQVEGDFERNEGTHSFLWDPERKQTLAVFTFVFELRGLLGLVPEGTLLKRAGRSLTSFMRRIEALIPRAIEEDPEHAARIEAAWVALRPRLERGDFPGRVWTGYPPPAAHSDVAIQAADVEPAGIRDGAGPAPAIPELRALTRRPESHGPDSGDGSTRTQD